MPSPVLTAVEWLDGINTGYGAKFGAAFEEVGAENTKVIVKIGPDEIAELEDELVKAGAKKLHLKVIREALEELKHGGEQGAPLPVRPDQPAPTDGSSPLKTRVATAGGKQFACFLSRTLHYPTAPVSS